MDSGWIYIAKNSDDINELYKVGKTTDPQQRKQSLNTSGVVGKIKFEELYKVDDNLSDIEKSIHKSLEKKGFKREKGKEWFHCPKEEIKKICNDIIKPKKILINYEDMEDPIYDYLIDYPETLSFKTLSEYANSQDWPGGVPAQFWKWTRAFYIFVKKNEIFHKIEFFEKLENGSDQNLQFQKELQNKLRNLNLKDFINSTNYYFPGNLSHLGWVLYLVRDSEKSNRILTIEWGKQIKSIIKNNHLEFYGGYLQYSHLEILEKFLATRRNFRI